MIRIHYSYDDYSQTINSLKRWNPKRQDEIKAKAKISSYLNQEYTENVAANQLKFQNYLLKK